MEQNNEILISLPDGKVLNMPSGSSALDVAEQIRPRLAREALAALVDGEVVDLARPLYKDVSLELLLPSDPRALPVLRHSAAHILGSAVRRLFPEARIGFGPAVEHGFYYDFGVEPAFVPEDLERIEAEMRRIIAEKQPFQREEVSRESARELFRDDPLKLERLEEIPEGEVISIYRNGDFLDLCRGPHVPDTGRIRHLRLLNAAAAYWRSDEKREVLQRIYGAAFSSKEDLAAYLERLEEAKRRDHRKIGKELDLFSVDERVGPGLILWHPRGAVIRQEVEDYERDLIRRHGYDLVATPHVVSEKLFEISGHLENFSEGMFPAMEMDEQRYRPKPMNCPGHICIYQSRVRSYRDLPLRYAEFGAVYRYERSGALHGMLRVRGFTQDDAHVFCTPEQVEDEVVRLLALVDEMLNTFGYPYSVEISTRPEKALGDREVWERAEALLMKVLSDRGIPFKVDAGGGAFYGPKLDFKLIDALGRAWQGPTVQLDFNLPERFELEFVGSDNERHRPVMLHRVLIGSMERFVGGLIEHYGGAFPLWLSPLQVMVLPISSEQEDEAISWARALSASGIRAEIDARNESLKRKIRDAEMQKIPFMAVMGERELLDGTIAVRERGKGVKQQIVARGEFEEHLKNLIRSKSLHL